MRVQSSPELARDHAQNALFVQSDDLESVRRKLPNNFEIRKASKERAHRLISMIAKIDYEIAMLKSNKLEDLNHPRKQHKTKRVFSVKELAKGICRVDSGE